MTDPENAQAPQNEGEDAAGEDGPEDGAPSKQKDTLQGLGANLRLPRPRASTVHSVKPATTLDESSETQDGSDQDISSGWKSVPLTELSIPSPEDVRSTAKAAPIPGVAPDGDFESESTQMADGLVVESHDLDDDFDGGEATQLGIPDEFIEEDAEIHDARLGVAQTAAVEPVELPENPSEESFEAVRRPQSDFQLEAPLPAPIKNDQAHEPADTAPVEEFEDQKTEVLNSPFESEPAVAKLHALEGPVAGQEFFVTQLRNTIGRGEGNSIMIADPAMSRQHMELTKNPDDSYTVRDLQSVNGTSLNGTRIRESDLYHGDRVEAGKTVFQFLVRGGAQQPSANRHLIPAASATMTGGFPAMDPRPSLPPAQQPPDQLAKLSTIVTVVAGVISLILVFGIGFLLLDGGLPGQDATPEKTASEIYLEAVESVKSRDWQEAERKFVEAHGLDDGLSIEAQMERIKKEKAAQQSYETLLEKYKAGEYDEVARLARAIPDDSVYHAEATELASKREKFALDTVYGRAQAAATREDFDAALEHIDEVLRRSPNHRGALALRDRIEEEIEEAARADEEAAAEKVATRQDAPSRDQPKRDAFDIDLDEPAPKKTSRRSKSRIINFTRGYQLYRSKEFDRAADFFAEVGRERSGPGARRAARSARDIRAFAASYQAGKRAFSTGNWSGARGPLKRAYRLDAAISGDRAYHRAELAGMLATTVANIGLQSLASKKYASARKQLDRARAYDSSASEVGALDKKVRGEARALYIKAANLRKKDPRVAAELCRDIMAMMPSKDATHQKAKRLLQEL